MIDETLSADPVTRRSQIRRAMGLEDDDVATAIAELVEQRDLLRRDLASMREKYTELAKRANDAIHEVEKAPAVRIFAVHIKCDGKRCSSVVAFDPAPEEPAMMQALLALGWSVGSGHLCRGCR